jgi:hypothetical protein
MQLLFENWRRYLKEGAVSDTIGKSAADRFRKAFAAEDAVRFDDPEESEESEESEEYVPLADDPIVRHNLHMLDTLDGPPATDRFAFPTSEEDMMSLVGSIPALRTSKIVKSVGSGTKKIAYKLDNDHIFSLFQSGYGGDEYSDLDWYAGIQDRQFKGESSIDEPAIHDFGEVPILPKMRYRPNVLKYVEMSGIVPLSDGGPPSLGAMAELDLVRLDFDIVQVAKFVEAAVYHGMLIKDPASLEEKVERVQHWWRNRKGLPFAEEEDILDLEMSALPPDLTMNLIKTLVRLAVRLKTTHVLQDIHPGNLGMSIEKPDEFVVIDI